MKKFISILLVLIIMISIIPCAAFAVSVDVDALLSGFQMPDFFKQIIELFRNFDFFNLLRVVISALGIISA